MRRVHWAVVGVFAAQVCLLYGTSAVAADPTAAIMRRLEQDRKFITTMAQPTSQAEGVMAASKSVSALLPNSGGGSFQSRHPVIDAGASLPFVGGLFATTRFVMIAGGGLVSSLRGIHAQDEQLGAPVRKALIACDAMLKAPSSRAIPDLVSRCRSATKAIVTGQRVYAVQRTQVTKLSALNNRAVAVWEQKNGSRLPQDHPLRTLGQSFHTANNLLDARDQVISHEKALFADVARLGARGH